MKKISSHEMRLVNDFKHPSLNIGSGDNFRIFGSMQVAPAQLRTSPPLDIPIYKPYEIVNDTKNAEPIRNYYDAKLNVQETISGIGRSPLTEAVVQIFAVILSLYMFGQQTLPAQAAEMPAQDNLVVYSKQQQQAPATNIDTASYLLGTKKWQVPPTTTTSGQQFEKPKTQQPNIGSTLLIANDDLSDGRSVGQSIMALLAISGFSAAVLVPQKSARF